MQVNNLVRLVKTGTSVLNDKEGVIVGFHGEYFPIIKFTDGIPEGYDPVICITDQCVEIIK